MRKIKDDVFLYNMQDFLTHWLLIKALWEIWVQSLIPINKLCLRLLFFSSEWTLKTTKAELNVDMILECKNAIREEITRAISHSAEASNKSLHGLNETTEST